MYGVWRLWPLYFLLLLPPLFFFYYYYHHHHHLFFFLLLLLFWWLYSLLLTFASSMDFSQWACFFTSFPFLFCIYYYYVWPLFMPGQEVLLQFMNGDQPILSPPPFFFGWWGSITKGGVYLMHKLVSVLSVWPWPNRSSTSLVPFGFVLLLVSHKVIGLLMFAV